MNHVTGHLREKRGYYHMVLNYVDTDGKRRSPSKTTGFKVRGNKKKAEAMLLTAIQEKEEELEQRYICDQLVKGEISFSSPDIQFTFFLQAWLEMMRGNLELTTYAGYSSGINNCVIPYFNRVYPRLLLCDVRAYHIQSYYAYERNVRGVSNNTLLHRHANIRKALQYAMRTGMISTNPADRIERPKAASYKAAFYSEAELRQLFEVSVGDPLEFGILTAAFYGLRRSEIAGLKWSAINFIDKTITISHTVTSAKVDGKYTLVQKDRTKTKSSYRTLPLVPMYEEKLLEMKARQERNQVLCGKCYNTEFQEYIYVDDLGNLIKPNYITAHFRVLLQNNGLRHIRFHDLRHSCASLLLAHGVNLKQIQEWLGHSTITTTGNIYAHLDVDSKRQSANAIIGLLDE